jgi:hypothetical protein
MRGIARRLQKEPKLRVPVTVELLLLWRSMFDLSLDDHFVAWTAILLAFFGLLRRSEFTLPDGLRFDPAKHLTRSCATLGYHRTTGRLLTLDLHIKFYKCEGTGADYAIPFTRVGGDLCVVEHVEEVLRRFPLLSPLDPLLPRPDGKALRTSEFANVVRRLVLQSPGLVGATLTPHSFRIGGAMALYEAGASDTVVMMMGRWKGSSFRRYLRFSRPIMLAWSKEMAVARCISTATGALLPWGRSALGVESTATRKRPHWLL